MRMKLIAAVLVALVGLAPAAVAEPSSGFNAVVLPGDLAFSSGGVNARYLILEDWAAGEDYGINSIVKHSSQVWAALADPAVGDEPGIAAAWTNLVAPVTRLLPDSPADDQIARYDSASSAWVAEDLPPGQGGASTFLALTDTPGTYVAGYALVVNAAGDAVEFVATASPSHQIVNVGRLPDPTVAGNPDLVYLTHDYTEGNKQDMTLTVGFEGMASGYSDGTYLQDTFGTVNEASPLNALFGAGDAADYSLQSVISFNRSWLDEFTHIEIAGTEYPLNPSFVSLGAYERRIQANPTGLSAATLTINFKRADNSWYFTDGGTLRHEAGLYEKVGNPPQYHDLAPIEDTHRTGSGNFACGASDPPTAGGQVCIDSDGAMWVATNRTLLFTEPPEITDITEFHV